MTQPEVPGSSDYATWSTSSLIERITELERQLNVQTTQNATVLSPSVKHAPASEVAGELPASLPDHKAKTNNTSPSPDDFTRVRSPSRPKKKVTREIDPSKYHTRFIALKLAYLGQRYNGFEHTNGNATPLPTIEEELWKAFRKARLIFPPSMSSKDNFENHEPRGTTPFTIDWENCQYSKGGRTDRGVSAFGQVVGIRVRSARPMTKSSKNSSIDNREHSVSTNTASVNSSQHVTAPDDSTVSLNVDTEGAFESESNGNWDDIADEIPYIQILNGILPEDIRVLAWCPRPPSGFDARFSCRERRYKYFFTQPAYSPVPGPFGFGHGAAQERGKSSNNLREGWLDIEAMREGAKHFEGRHDFRNFAKVDTGKQIQNFQRIIYHASIDLVDPRIHPLGYVNQPEFQAQEATEPEKLVAEGNINPSTPLVYTFTLHGSAFLWHQVRHMVSVLFLIGQGLESPSIITELLDVSKNPGKPIYEMATDAPLVLWDCIFPDKESGIREDALDWVYCGDPRLSKSSTSKGNGKFGLGGLVDDLWTVWRQRKMDEILAGALLNLTVSQHDQNTVPNSMPKKQFRTQRVFNGGNEARGAGPYIPVMQRRKMDSVEVQNARYLANRERRAEKERVDGLQHM